MIRVVVADNNVELCNTLREYLNGLEDMEVVGCAYDGEQALAQIEAGAPDVVVLDLTMPYLDGLGVLERLNRANGSASGEEAEANGRPAVIVLTAFGREDVIQKFTDLGANYFIVKPFDLEVLAQRIRQFARADKPILRETATTAPARPKGVDYEAQVTALLHEMGVPAHFKGYAYLRDAVVLVLREDRMLGGSLTKELYPRLAEKYNTTPGGVEAAIRNAIIAAWEHGNREFLMKLTGKVGRSDRFPTNSLIIAKMADRIRFSGDGISVATASGRRAG